MGELKLQDELRAAHVRRWVIIRTHHGQSVAEHSWKVAMIAWEICDLLGVDPAHAVMLACAHDVAEVALGDIPTPAKVRLKKAGVDMDQIEMEISPRLRNALATASALDHEIVKMADIIEAVDYLCDEASLPRHAEHIIAYMRMQFGKRVEAAQTQWPELKWMEVLKIPGRLRQAPTGGLDR